MPRSKSKSKSASKSKKTSSPKSARRYTKTLMDINECMTKTLKEIRKTQSYKRLIPYGVGKRKGENPNQKYHFGNKSTMRKAELCEALSNPKKYHMKLKKAYGDGKKKSIKNTGPRKRYSRTGDCRPYRRKPPCKGDKPHKGVTTTGEACCYKKKQSEATIAKRKRNASKVKKEKAKYNRSKKITQKSVGRKRKVSRKVSKKVSKKKSTKKKMKRVSKKSKK